MNGGTSPYPGFEPTTFSNIGACRYNRPSKIATYFLKQIGYSSFVLPFTVVQSRSPSFTFVHRCSPSFPFVHRRSSLFTFVHLRSPSFTFIHRRSPSFIIVHRRSLACIVLFTASSTCEVIPARDLRWIFNASVDNKPA